MRSRVHISRLVALALLLGACVGLPDRPRIVVIPDTTKVLDQSVMQHLSSISPDGTELVFADTTSALLTLSPGDVIISPVTTATPVGLLRKVRHVTRSRGQTIIQTEAVALEQAIESGLIDVRATLAPDDIRADSRIAGCLPERRYGVLYRNW